MRKPPALQGWRLEEYEGCNAMEGVLMSTLHTFSHNLTTDHRAASPARVETPGPAALTAATIPTQDHARSGDIGKWETGRRVTEQQARRTGQRLTDSDRLKSCGVRPIAGAAEVTVDMSEDGDIRFGKLQTCKSRWLCPYCAPRIARDRAVQVAKMVKAHVGAGGSVAMAVLNQPHFWKDSLEWLVGVDKSAWGKLTSSNTWKGPNGIRKRYGITLPPVWALEDTHGSQGWNWHRNLLLFLDRPLSQDQVEALENELYELWARVVVKAGGRRPSAAQGVKVAQAVDAKGAAAMGAYAVKGDPADMTAEEEKAVEGIALEVMAGTGKLGRKGRTHFQVLNDITAAYEAGEEPKALDVRIWKEWEKYHLENVTRQVHVPKALEELLEVEEVDEAAAANEDSVDGKRKKWVSIAGIDRQAWRERAAHDLELQEQVRAAGKAAAGKSGDRLAARLAVIGVLEEAGVRCRSMDVELSSSVDSRAWRTDTDGARAVLEAV